MKLHQLRYICEVARKGLNISEAAEALHTSQPGVSKQIQLLEEELGLPIFNRTGKRLTGVTQPGEEIIRTAERILLEVSNIKKVGQEYTSEATGTLSIATTHTQGRYALPQVIKQFKDRYPLVKLRIRQGNPSQIIKMVQSGEADIAIATESVKNAEGLISMPCFHWNRAVVVPHGHQLLDKRTPLTLKDIAEQPLITYDFAIAGRTVTNKAFHDAGLEPNIVLSAIDSDIIKAYVELGLGVGLLAKMAYDPVRDTQLSMIDVGHLFEASTTWIGVPHGTYVRQFLYDFIQLFAPHLGHDQVERAMSGRGIDWQLEELELAER